MRPLALISLGLLQVNPSVSDVLKPQSFLEANTDEYRFHRPIRKVAVIGAGPSGLATYRELIEVGFDVRVFERDSVPGGIWHYTDDIPVDAPIPNAHSAVSDFTPSLPEENVDFPYSEVFWDGNGDTWRDHRGPKPVWESLTANAPSPAQQFCQWPFPPGMPLEVSQYELRNYLRSYASYLNINSNDGNTAITYNTRVEYAEKRENGWRLWVKSIESTEPKKYRATWWTEDFDAIAVATGKFNAPSMPPIPGLEEWARRFPGLIRHSRQYRRPDTYTNQTVLLVGASTSGSEISRDLNRHVKAVIQSFRPDTDSRLHYRQENYLRRVPKNTTLVGEIDQFLPLPEGASIQSGLIELKNGTVLSGIDSIIFSTGFRFSFPFLPQYYDGATFVSREGSAEPVTSFIPLDGSHIRDLYLDLFYIGDPTLTFIGAPFGTQAFYFAEYSAMAVAKVWSNTAKLPSAQIMQQVHEKSVEERGGYGKHFMFLGPDRASAFLRYLVGWLNMSAAKYGGKQMDGLPHYIKEVTRYWQISHYGAPLEVRMPKEDGSRNFAHGP